MAEVIPHAHYHHMLKPKQKNEEININHKWLNNIWNHMAQLYFLPAIYSMYL